MIQIKGIDVLDGDKPTEAGVDLMRKKSGGQYKDPKEKFNNGYMPITETGCWIWMGSVDKNGYGFIRVYGKPCKPHRYSWELRNGTMPKGMHVLHKCDIPSCVNPDHLFLGTHKDNMRDASRKGRLGGKGTVPKDVSHMHDLWNYGFTQKEIGEMYRLNDATVWHHLNNSIWGNV